MNGIDKSITALAVDIDDLTPLETNARRGNVSAIKASYEQFGQLKPIVAVRDNEGKLVVIAGNHQLEAARQLGWDKIAVSVVDLNTDDAVAYALADNRTSDLGTTDSSILLEMMNSIGERPVELFDALEWDAFAFAALENSGFPRSLDVFDSNSGWSPPEIVMKTVAPDFPQAGSTGLRGERDFGDGGLTATRPSASLENIVTQGSTASGSSGVSNALVQYTLVFENPSQQSKWYAFMRWLRDNKQIQGDTTAERLMSFIDMTVEL